MHRRNFLTHTGLLTGSALLLQKSVLASFFNMADYNIKMLRNNVGIFTERGGTIGFLVSKDGIVVVDAQFPDTASHFIEEAKKQSQQPFRYLLNTHHHMDHTAGNIAFKGLTEHVLAHENSLTNQKVVAENQNIVDKQLYPDLTFSTETKVKLPNDKITGYYYGPGHTNGDAMYHFEDANIVHMGDLVFNRRHPFVDRSAGANMQHWIEVLNTASKKFDKDTMFIFGHAMAPYTETGAVEDLKKFADYLSKVVAFAGQEIKAGKSKEEFIQNTSIPGVTEWQGDGIQRPLTAAYEELTSK